MGTRTIFDVRRRKPFVKEGMVSSVHGSKIPYETQKQKRAPPRKGKKQQKLLKHCENP